jgi:hypothetical protein
MIGLSEPSGEEIARRAHGLFLQRGGEHGKDVVGSVVSFVALARPDVYS